MSSRSISSASLPRLTWQPPIPLLTITSPPHIRAALIQPQHHTLPHPIRHASTAHTTLATFLQHASRTSLSQSSPTFIGTLYEYHCLAALSRLGFTLTRVGGRGDEGIDLTGTWTLPGIDAPLDAVVQCKALRMKTGPALVRELEGVVARAKVGTVGVLCARLPATRGVREAMRGAGWPVVWVQVEDGVGENGNSSEDGEGMRTGTGTGRADLEGRGVRVRQMLWNEAVERVGARGLDVTVKRTGDSEDGDGEIALMWKGNIWKPGAD